MLPILIFFFHFEETWVLYKQKEKKKNKPETILHALRRQEPVDRVHAVVDRQFFEPVVQLRLNLKWDVSDRVFDH